MISTEDIKRLKQEKDRVEKNATLQDTPITHQKNDTHRNTHHTRQGGRTDHSTSSHGLVPSSTDRVMWVVRTWCIIIWGWSGIVADYLIKEIKGIRGLWR